MSGVYVDTSALGRVLLGEPDGAAILAALEDFEQRVGSRLVAVELRRLALRRSTVDDANRLLGALALVPIDERILVAAESITPPSVATLDAIHLATAIVLARDGFVDAVMTYDAELAGGAHEHGLGVIAPS